MSLFRDKVQETELQQLRVDNAVLKNENAHLTAMNKQLVANIASLQAHHAELLAEMIGDAKAAQERSTEPSAEDALKNFLETGGMADSRLSRLRKMQAQLYQQQKADEAAANNAALAEGFLS